MLLTGSHGPETPKHGGRYREWVRTVGKRPQHSTAFQMQPSCLRAPVGVHTRPCSPHLEGLASSRYTLHPPGFVENLKIDCRVPGARF